MDADEDLRNSEININPYEQMNENRPTVPNLNKLTCNEIFYQKDNNLHIKELKTPEKVYDLRHFKTDKGRYQKGIAKFKQNNNVEEINIIGRYRKRGKSIDSQLQGAYYLYNWISVEQYPCQKPPNDDKSAHIIYQILANNWSKALYTVSQLNRTLEVTTLEFILKGFKIIEQLIYEESQYFQEHFMGRQRFPIIWKASSDNVGGLTPILNIFQQEARHAFRELRVLPKKVECLRMNLEYMVKFASKYKVSNKADDYIVLAFKILGNLIDQNELHPYPDKEYTKILAHLNLKINDRLNFASKLLPEKKRKIFCNELDLNLTRFPRLENILYYLPAISKAREKKIQQITQTYLDETSDLQTVAYLSVEYPFLRSFYRLYQQLLYFSDQHRQLENLQNIRFDLEGEQKDTGEISRNIKMTNFFDFINIAEEKMTEVKMVKESSNICQICSKKILKNQMFLECGKCRHGGHASHLLKWFEESQNCPHIGCPCICN